MYKRAKSYCVLISLLAFITSCSISEDDIVELALEKNIQELSNIIDEEYYAYKNEVKEDKKAKAKNLLLIAFDEGMKNNLKPIINKAEDIYWKDETINLDILFKFNKNNITLLKKEKFLESSFEIIYSKNYRHNEYEMYCKQQKLIGNEVIENYLKGKLRKILYNKNWEKLQFYYDELVKVNNDTINYDKNILDLKKIILYKNSIDRDNLGDISQKYLTLENKYDEVSKNISELSSDIQSNSDELEEKQAALGEIFAKIYEFQQSTFYVKAYLVDGIGNNEYEIAFSDGRGILKMVEHYYKYKGFIEILTYPLGYRTVVLNNGFTAQWMVYEEVPDRDKLYHYQNLIQYENLKEEISKLKYSINIQEAKLSQLNNKKDYYNNIMSKLKEDIKKEYANLCTAFENKFTPILN